MTSQSPFTSQGITAYAKFGQTSQKLLGQTTMLIMELEWRMRLVQNLPQSQLYLSARYRLVCYKTTTKRTLAETEVM
jgi:hypothetical protein